MEWYVFNGDLDDGLNDQQQRTCIFRMPDGGGFFDGFHMRLQVQLDETTALDTFEQSTTWECTYVKLLEVPLWLRGGAQLEFRCRVHASIDCPSYYVDVFAQTEPIFLASLDRRLSHIASYAWSGDG